MFERKIENDVRDGKLVNEIANLLLVKRFLSYALKIIKAKTLKTDIIKS